MNIECKKCEKFCSYMKYCNDKECEYNQQKIEPKKNSKAREMFWKLGYEREFTIAGDIRYLYDEQGSFRIVEFDITRKGFACFYSSDGEAFRIDTNLLKAINKQCKELGWL